MFFFSNRIPNNAHTSSFHSREEQQSFKDQELGGEATASINLRLLFFSNMNKTVISKTAKLFLTNSGFYSQFLMI
jgi:hypothetical protein